MLCPVDFDVTWSGDEGLDALTITADHSISADSPDAYLSFLLGLRGGGKSGQASGKSANFIESHFGSGILTFNPMVILRTAPGYHLWVTGPVNHFKDAIQPMSALIAADWMPFTFSVNWKMTRPGETVSFRQGEPFCAFFPVQHGVIDRTEPRLRPLSDDPELEQAYWSARLERNLASALGADDNSRFQSWYARGLTPGEAAKNRNTGRGEVRDAGRGQRPQEANEEMQRAPVRPCTPRDFT